MLPPKCRTIICLCCLKFDSSKKAKDRQFGRRREKIGHFPEGIVERHRKSGASAKLGN